MKLILPLLLVVSLLTSCAGTGEGGSWTAADTESTTRAINGIYQTGAGMYRDYQSGYRAQPYVQPTVAPVAPVAPLY